MAIRENLPSRVRLSLQVGHDQAGNAIVRNRTYNRLRHTATDADVAAVADALGALQKHTLLFVHRIDEARVIPE